MRRALEFLREAIDAFHRGESAAELARARDPALDEEPASAAYALRLASNEGKDALAEVRERAELPAAELEWLALHQAGVGLLLARGRAERAVRERLRAIATPTGGRLELGEELSRLALTADARSREEACRALESQLLPPAEARAAAQLRVEALAYVEAPSPREPDEARAAAPASPQPASSLLIVSAFAPDVLSPPRRDLAPRPWLEHARAFLDATDAAAEDAVRFLVRHLHGRGASGAVPWHTLLGALRASELDSEVGRKQRWPRASAFLRGLGFEEVMGARLRAEVDHGAALPLARVLRVDAPRDVRLAQSARDFGVLSDVCAAEAVGRGLCAALVHVALPPELRYPLGASVAGALGTTAMLAFCDRGQLTRIQGLTETQAERIARLGGTAILLWARLCASLALVPGTEPERPGARLELACEAIGRALTARIEPAIAGALAPDRLLARARGLEALAGLAAAAGLREQLDADWFRNPRAGDRLRGLAQRGNRLAPEAMCAELGVSLASAAARAVELVG